MATLKSVLNDLGITGAHRESILRMAKEYREEGLSGPEAARKAVEDLKADADNQIKDVSKQISEKQHGPQLATK